MNTNKKQSISPHESVNNMCAFPNHKYEAGRRLCQEICLTVF